MKNWYTDTHKILLKEIEEDINKWKDILWFRIGRINIAKCLCYPEQHTYSIQFLSKCQRHFHRNRGNNSFESIFKAYVSCTGVFTVTFPYMLTMYLG
jgi:hypothetical protein